jgi:hypothetical protein
MTFPRSALKCGNHLGMYAGLNAECIPESRKTVFTILMQHLEKVDPNRCGLNEKDCGTVGTWEARPDIKDIAKFECWSKCSQNSKKF